MRIRQSLPLALTLGLLVMVSLAPLSQRSASYDASPSLKTTSAPSTPQSALANYGHLPISFEVNQGQADSQVRFLARGTGYNLFLTPAEALLALGASGHAPAISGNRFSPAALAPSSLAPASQDALVGMHFLNANSQPEVTGEQPLPGIVNYFLGNDPATWHTNIPTYG